MMQLDKKLSVVNNQQDQIGRFLGEFLLTRPCHHEREREREREREILIILDRLVRAINGT